VPSPPGSDGEQRDDADGGADEQHQGGRRAGFGGAQGGQQAADAEQRERGEAAGGGVVSNRAVVSILNWTAAPAGSTPGRLVVTVLPASPAVTTGTSPSCAAPAAARRSCR
jgi:hypothetical protein